MGLDLRVSLCVLGSEEKRLNRLRLQHLSTRSVTSPCLPPTFPSDGRVHPLKFLSPGGSGGTRVSRPTFVSVPVCPLGPLRGPSGPNTKVYDSVD